MKLINKLFRSQLEAQMASEIKRAILQLGHAPLPQPPQATLHGILLRDAPIEPIYGDGGDVDAPPELHASSRR